MDRSPQNFTAATIGLFFIIIGITGFLFQGLIAFVSTVTLHNTLHLIIGAIATPIGVWGSVKAARLFNRVLAALLLALTIAGFLGVAGMELMLFDNLTYLFIGVATLGITFIKE